MEIGFFIKARPNFWPQIENRLWVVLALNKKPGALNKKQPFFVLIDHYAQTSVIVQLAQNGKNVGLRQNSRKNAIHSNCVESNGRLQDKTGLIGPVNQAINPVPQSGLG